MSIYVRWIGSVKEVLIARSSILETHDPTDSDAWAGAHPERDDPHSVMATMAMPARHAGRPAALDGAPRSNDLANRRTIP